MRKDWEVKTWNEVLSIINGKNQKHVEDSNGTYPIYGSGGIMGYANDFLCPNNTVIIGRKGNINKPIFVEEKFWNVDTAFGLVPKEGILVAKYLYYYCVNYDFEKLNKAVTIPSLTKSDLLNIKIALPPYLTQQQIVEELDSLTSIIEKQKKQLEELDNLAQAIFYDMFGDPIENEKGWDIKKLGDLCISDLGKTLNKSKDTGNSLPYLCSINIQWNYIDLSVKKEALFEENEINKYSVFKGDLLVCEGGDIGRAAIWKEDYSMLYQNALHRIRFDKNIIAEYVLYFLWRLKQKGILDTRYAKGVTIKHLVKSSLLSINIPVPPLSLQQQFASKIEAIEKQKELIKKSIKETEDLFNSRMDYYFN